MSISKIQAQAIAEGFLDSIGTAEEALIPTELCTELVFIVGEMIEEAQMNLIASNKIAKGNLSESLVATEPRQEGSVIQVDMLMNFYGKFVNKGVSGTRKQYASPYSFKDEFPSKSMVLAIENWILRAQRHIRTVKHLKGFGAHEIKNRSISELSDAYAVARSIKIHGLKPTGFLDKVIESASAKFSERLGAALKVDVMDALKR